MTKVITFTFDGYGKFSIDKEPIAMMEAFRRCEVDHALNFMNFKEEFDHLMKDDHDVYDYLINSMDFEEFEMFIIKKEIFGKDNWKSRYENYDKDVKEEDI